jgi:hypothetical protein
MEIDMHVRGGKSPSEWDKIKHDFLVEVRHRTGADFSLNRINGRWASGPRGVVGIVSGEERPEGDRWFMGLDERALDEREPLGVILVCEGRDGRRIVVGFGASRWTDLARRMSRDRRRGELKFDLRKRGDRYLLAGAEVTSALNDLSWLGETDMERDHTQPEAGSITNAPSASQSLDRNFFARVRGGALEPMDPTGLPEGEVVLVSTRPAPVVPSNATLRRLIAAGGPPSLPPDFADQHDTHAHGAPRR